MTKFSVIIPTYNRANDLNHCLSSLVTQTYKNFEVIVCDDGSTDNIREVVEQYSEKLNLVYIYKEHWGGPARPRNEGIRLAKADWICFLDSDDWWYPNKLEEGRKYLENNDIIYHDLDVYNSETGAPLFCLHSRQLSDDPFRDLLVNNNALFNSSVIVRKSILEKIGLLSEDKRLISIEDLDCWLSISKLTNKFFYLSESLGAYRLESNISRKMKHADSLEVLCYKHVKDLKSEKDRKYVIKTLRYNQARISQINKFYFRAFYLYLQAGSISFTRLYKYIYNKIFIPR